MRGFDQILGGIKLCHQLRKRDAGACRVRSFLDLRFRQQSAISKIEIRSGYGQRRKMAARNMPMVPM